jgi:hypothetical protein
MAKSTVAVLAALFCTSAAAQETISGEGMPAKVVFDSPGHVTFDARPPNVLFPAPAQPRSFASDDALKQFLITDLNGQLQADGSLRTEASVIGDSGYPDANGKWQDVGCDAVAEYMVGRFGYFLLKGSKVALDRKACTGGAMAALGGKRNIELTATSGACTSPDRFGQLNCVRNETWASNFAFIVHYHGRGAGTFQGTTSIPRCSFRPFPFFQCTGGPRPNDLVVNFALTDAPINALTLARTAVGKNVDRVQAQTSSWRFLGGNTLESMSPGTCGSSFSTIPLGGTSLALAIARSNEPATGSVGVRMSSLCTPLMF